MSPIFTNFIFFIGQPPFNDESATGIFDNIRRRDIYWPDDDIENTSDPNYEQMVSDDARSLIDIFLSTDPSKRPTAEEATQHEFFKNGHINFETLRENEAPFVPELEDNMDTSYFDNRELHDLSLFLTKGEHHGGIYGESRKGEETEATSLVEEAVELDMMLEIGPLTISSPPPPPPQIRRKSSNDAMRLDHILGIFDLPSSSGLTNGSDATTTTTTTTTTTAAAKTTARRRMKRLSLKSSRNLKTKGRL